MPRHDFGSVVRVLAAVGCCSLPWATAGAQDQPAPLSRSQAIEGALNRGARFATARADTAVAAAQLLAAHALPNPTLSTSYSKATPQYHVTAELPIDLPGIRQTRIASARASREAAQYRFQFERAAVALDADTTYTRALAALERARLSRRNAQDADSLHRLTVARRDAGDASDLDVELATVNAGQQANTAAADSLAAISLLLDLQSVIGLVTDRLAITPSDSLQPPTDTTDGDGIHAPPAGMPLPIAAAQASLESAQLAARLQRRSLFSTPAIIFGFEAGDPSGQETGILPTVGVALPLPLLNRNRGAIAQAEAERERANAELTLARLETQTRIARTSRERTLAMAKVERDRRLLTSADRVATMSLTAYREGASTLPNVLEAQRNAREIRAQYVDDLAAAWIAGAALRVYTLTATANAR